MDALNLPIPVFHDDQHGTASVVLAALINALDIVKKDIRDVLIVIAGAGAAGYGIVNLLYHAGARNMMVIDSKGIITKYNREEKHKKRIGELTNPSSIEGSLIDAIDGADVFIGVSGKANLIDRSILKKMNEPIIFALSNPDPEIMPEDAKEARIIATGRSDYPNQINN